MTTEEALAYAPEYYAGVLSRRADDLERVFNKVADIRDALPSRHPLKSRYRKLAKMAEKAMKALDREGVTR